jgi:hypothetical protein
VADDPATAFDSTQHGDPETLIGRARVGDPIVLRTLVAAANEVHTLHVDGHGFRIEPWLDTSPLVATAHLGISERLDLVIPTAGGPAGLPGDYPRVIPVRMIAEILSSRRCNQSISPRRIPSTRTRKPDLITRRSSRPSQLRLMVPRLRVTCVILRGIQ